MKKLLISALLTIFFFSSKAQTTWTEYKYLKNGVVDYLDRGIDLKAGYKLFKAGNYSLNFGDGARYVSLYDFKKVGDKNRVALLIVYYKQPTKKTYIVVPSANSPEEMWNDYNLTLNSIDHMGNALETVSYALGRYTSNKF